MTAYILHFALCIEELMMENPYLPIPMVVKKAQVETSDRMLKTLELSFINCLLYTSPSPRD